MFQCLILVGTITRPSLAADNPSTDICFAVDFSCPEFRCLVACLQALLLSPPGHGSPPRISYPTAELVDQPVACAPRVTSGCSHPLKNPLIPSLQRQASNGDVHGQAGRERNYLFSLTDWQPVRAWRYVMTTAGEVDSYRDSAGVAPPPPAVRHRTMSRATGISQPPARSALMPGIATSPHSSQ